MEALNYKQTDSYKKCFLQAKYEMQPSIKLYPRHCINIIDNQFFHLFGLLSEDQIQEIVIEMMELNGEEVLTLEEIKEEVGICLINADAQEMPMNY